MSPCRAPSRNAVNERGVGRIRSLLMAEKRDIRMQSCKGRGSQLEK